jgi:hypothetical protein
MHVYDLGLTLHVNVNVKMKFIRSVYIFVNLAIKLLKLNTWHYEDFWIKNIYILISIVYYDC